MLPEEPPSKLIPLIQPNHPAVRIGYSQDSGRHTIAKKRILPNQIIDRIPVLVLPTTQIKKLKKTDLYAYVFEWDIQERYLVTGDLVQCDPRYSQGVALGLISLCNHSDFPNATYRFNYREKWIDWVAIKPIHKDQEITIHYRVPLWFEVSDES